MPEVVNVSALVTFTPRIPAGSFLYRDDGTALALPVRYARIWQGQLCTINTVDTPGVYLQANLVIGYEPVTGLGPSPSINLLDSIGISELIYDVTFDKITFGSRPVTYPLLPDGSKPPVVLVTAQQKITPFAFVAPTDPEEQICLTDPGLKRLPWQKPLPSAGPVG
jgi:hypothetical protein